MTHQHIFKRIKAVGESANTIAEGYRDHIDWTPQKDVHQQMAESLHLCALEEAMSFMGNTQRDTVDGSAWMWTVKLLEVRLAVLDKILEVEVVA